MKPLHALAFLAAAAVPAMAQTYYSDRPYNGDRLTRDEYRTCVERERVLRGRREAIEDERAEVDREATDIAQAGAALDFELRHLDRSNPQAVAAYNAHSDQHNRRVARQNRHVADVNARAALMNGDAADMNARCEDRVYTPYGRDAEWRDRDRSTFR